MTWTLVLITLGGLGTPQPALQPGYKTEQACKEAAHKFMHHQEAGLWWNEAWIMNEGYNVRCIPAP
jgi:hypothetical protein